jgi:hypothetical protein
LSLARVLGSDWLSVCETMRVELLCSIRFVKSVFSILLKAGSVPGILKILGIDHNVTLLPERVVLRGQKVLEGL